MGFLDKLQQNFAQSKGQHLLSLILQNQQGESGTFLGEEHLLGTSGVETGSRYIDNQQRSFPVVNGSDRTQLKRRRRQGRIPQLMRYPWIGLAFDGSVDLMYDSINTTVTPGLTFALSDYHLDKYRFTPLPASENPFFSTSFNAAGEYEIQRYDSGLPTLLRSGSLSPSAKYTGATVLFDNSDPFGRAAGSEGEIVGSSGVNTVQNEGQALVSYAVHPRITSEFFGGGNSVFETGSTTPQPVGDSLLSASWGANEAACGFASNGLQLRALTYNYLKAEFTDYNPSANVVLTGQYSSFFTRELTGRYRRTRDSQLSSVTLGSQVQSQNGTSAQYFFVWRRVTIKQTKDSIERIFQPVIERRYAAAFFDPLTELSTEGVLRYGGTTGLNLAVTDPGGPFVIGDTITVTTLSGHGNHPQYVNVGIESQDEERSRTWTPEALGSPSQSVLDLGEVQNLAAGAAEFLAYEPPASGPPSCGTGSGYDPDINVTGYQLGLSIDNDPAVPTTYNYALLREQRLTFLRDRSLILVTPNGWRYWCSITNNSATNSLPLSLSETTPINSFPTWTFDGSIWTLEVVHAARVDWDYVAGDVEDIPAGQAVLYSENDLLGHQIDPDTATVVPMDYTLTVEGDSGGAN